MRSVRLLLPALLAAASPAAAQSPTRAGASEQDYVAGRRLVDAAIRATGDSAALAALGTLTATFCARAVELGQSARPDAPYDTIRAAGRRIYDLAGRRYAQEWSTEFRGGIPLALHEVVTDSAAYSLDRRGGVPFTVAPSGLAASLRRVEDNSPYAPLVLLDRARRNATSIRIVHPAGSRSPNAVLFVDRATVTTLEIDPRTHLVVSAEALYDNWAVGLGTLRVEFLDYQRVGPVRLAARVRTSWQQGVLTDVVFAGVARTAAPPPEAFQPPSDSAHAVPIGGALHISIDSVAPHVFAVRFGQTAGPNFGYNPPFAYAQLLVELTDRLLLVDAPWSATVQQAVIDSVHRRFPAKPIALIAFTHYHSDHFGGLRAYLGGKTRFITTPGNRRFIERVATASHPLDSPGPGAASDAASRIETFTGTHSIADSAAPVDLHEVGGAHADEMVIAWLPRQHLLFTADLFGIFPEPGGPGGSYEAERALARYVLGQGWKVETVVSGHAAIVPGSVLGATLTQGSDTGRARQMGVPACPPGQRF
jgi:glyoxylase-like metal-dependent hydrolase (beta-lactamase superfamily II)